MENAAARLFRVMQKSGTDTITQLVSFTVKSINPIVLTDGNKLVLTEEFYLFHKSIDTTKIVTGDKFIALELNAGQLYYIIDILESTNELITYNQEIKDLKDRISTLENDISSLDSRVTALENNN